MSFQTRLREARDLTGLKQTQVARLLGVHVITYHLWESERMPRTPRDQTVLAKLADVLGVNVAWLLTGEGKPRKRRTS